MTSRDAHRLQWEGAELEVGAGAVSASGQPAAVPECGACVSRRGALRTAGS